MNEHDWSREELQKYSDEMIAVTVPVNIRIEGKQKILDLKTAEILLKKARVISVGNCDCRERWKKCDSPLDVCLGLDGKAEDLIEQGHAKKISAKQALDVLKRTHKAGLVHLAFTTKGEEKTDYICSCCSCCCHALSAIVRFNMPYAVSTPERVAIQDREKCTHCGTCVQRCQFHARRIADGKLVFDSGKCFGCGLCASTCPNGAIFFMKRS